MNRKQLKEKMADAIDKAANNFEHYTPTPYEIMSISDCLEYAEAALSAIENEGLVISRKDQPIKTMSLDEFDGMVETARNCVEKFKDNNVLCQANTVPEEEHGSASPHQSTTDADTFSPELWAKADIATKLHQDQIQGFRYPKKNIVRDCTKDDGIIWERMLPKDGECLLEMVKVDDEMHRFKHSYRLGLIQAEYWRLIDERSDTERAENSDGSLTHK